MGNVWVFGKKMPGRKLVCTVVTDREGTGALKKMVE